MTIYHPSNGQMACGMPGCLAVYGHPVVLDGGNTPRQQLQHASSLVGWRQTSSGLDMCPDDARDEASILIPGWTLRWAPPFDMPMQAGPPVMIGDDVQTTTLPAVVEPVPVPAGRRPYDSPKGDAA